jgi:hypothetical protein
MEGSPEVLGQNRVLFFASTIISIGDGHNTRLWEARWINGMAPKELAPNFYKKARFKYRSVQRELHMT